MSNTDKCGCLRATTSNDSPNVGAACSATSDSQCPKIRSVKRQVGHQCWRIKTGAPAAKKVADPAPSASSAPVTAPQ